MLIYILKNVIVSNVKFSPLVKRQISGETSEMACAVKTPVLEHLKETLQAFLQQYDTFTNTC